MPTYDPHRNPAVSTNAADNGADFDGSYWYQTTWTDGNRYDSNQT